MVISLLKFDFSFEFAHNIYKKISLEFHSLPRYIFMLMAYQTCRQDRENCTEQCKDANQHT